MAVESDLTGLLADMREELLPGQYVFICVAAWIALQVHSALYAVGLTAAVSSALAEAGVSCNVIAGYHHDHLLVPFERGQEALTILRALVDAAAPGPLR